MAKTEAVVTPDQVIDDIDGILSSLRTNRSTAEATSVYDFGTSLGVLAYDDSLVDALGGADAIYFNAFTVPLDEGYDTSIVVSFGDEVVDRLKSREYEEWVSHLEGNLESIFNSVSALEFDGDIEETEEYAPEENSLESSTLYDSPDFEEQENLEEQEQLEEDDEYPIDDIEDDELYRSLTEEAEEDESSDWGATEDDWGSDANYSVEAGRTVKSSAYAFPEDNDDYDGSDYAESVVESGAVADDLRANKYLPFPEDVETENDAEAVSDDNSDDPYGVTDSIIEEAVDTDDERDYLHSHEAHIGGVESIDSTVDDLIADEAAGSDSETILEDDGEELAEEYDELLDEEEELETDDVNEDISPNLPDPVDSVEEEGEEGEGDYAGLESVIPDADDWSSANYEPDPGSEDTKGFFSKLRGN